eukprot:scaffold1020_cov182-Alexandrium_tamarense.AAC.21
MVGCARKTACHYYSRDLSAPPPSLSFFADQHVGETAFCNTPFVQLHLIPKSTTSVSSSFPPFIMSFRDLTPPRNRSSGTSGSGGIAKYSPTPSRGGTPQRQNSLPRSTQHQHSQQHHNIINNKCTISPAYQFSYREEFSHPSTSTNDNEIQGEVSTMHQRLVEQREEQYAMEVMRQREEELKEINQKMHVVNEIYKDLGEVVDEQQDQIDELEGQFGRTADQTKRGLDQLEKANRRGNKRSGNCIDSEKEDGANKRSQFFLLNHFRKGATGMAAKISAVPENIAKMVSVCAGGSASASYAFGEQNNGR